MGTRGAIISVCAATIYGKKGQQSRGRGFVVPSCHIWQVPGL
eukprot:gene26257-biopygen15354